MGRFTEVTSNFRCWLHAEDMGVSARFPDSSGPSERVEHRSGSTVAAKRLQVDAKAWEILRDWPLPGCRDLFETWDSSDNPGFSPLAVAVALDLPNTTAYIMDCSAYPISVPYFGAPTQFHWKAVFGSRPEWAQRYLDAAIRAGRKADLGLVRGTIITQWTFAYIRAVSQQEEDPYRAGWGTPTSNTHSVSVDLVETIIECEGAYPTEGQGDLNLEMNWSCSCRFFGDDCHCPRFANGTVAEDVHETVCVRSLFGLCRLAVVKCGPQFESVLDEGDPVAVHARAVKHAWGHLFPPAFVEWAAMFETEDALAAYFSMSEARRAFMRAASTTERRAEVVAQTNGTLGVPPAGPTHESALSTWLRDNTRRVPGADGPASGTSIANEYGALVAMFL